MALAASSAVDEKCRHPKEKKGIAELNQVRTHAYEGIRLTRRFQLDRRIFTGTKLESEERKIFSELLAERTRHARELITFLNSDFSLVRRYAHAGLRRIMCLNLPPYASHWRAAIRHAEE